LEICENVYKIDPKSVSKRPNTLLLLAQEKPKIKECKNAGKKPINMQKGLKNTRKVYSNQLKIHQQKR
tara:strand:+ start:211 stop:414 length:204 start_codon:yes stop_codon:yes gene_type:complete